MFKIESNTAKQEDEQQDSVDEENEAEIKGYFTTESLNAETEEDKDLNRLYFNKKKYPHLASFIRKYRTTP